MGSLDGRAALVTGASRGIGAAIARRLAAEGAAVAVTARTLEPDPRLPGSLRETVEQIRAAGGTGVAVPGDLARSSDRERIVAEALGALGPVDILVNNAAVTFFSPLESIPEKRFKLMVEIQLWAPVHLTQLVLPGMYAKGSGWVLNISSRSAVHAVGPPFAPVQGSGMGVYGMVKAGLERMTNALAAEGFDRGIRANTLSPWDNVATPGAAAHDLVEGVKLEDESIIAEAALHLCCSDITGRVTYSQQLLAELAGA